MADTEVQGGFFTAGTVPNREFVLRFCKEKYGTEPEYLWMDEPTFAVLRHGDNKKWYALLMSVSRSKLGVSGSADAKDPDAKADILNVKCDPALVSSLVSEPGYRVAYHMNKTKWLSIYLDGRVSPQQIAYLLDLSFKLTQNKSARK